VFSLNTTNLATPYTVVLNPGEVLFVPSGCPHSVENLEDSVAISANYISLHSNFQSAFQDLETNGLVHSKSRQLAAYLKTRYGPLKHQDGQLQEQVHVLEKPN